MKFVYGQPLDSEELAIWHALHGGGTYDSLYYLTDVHDSGVPYVEGREYTDITMILGRRTAKSCMGAFMQCYELLCGGHQARLAIADQSSVFLYVSQDLGQAMSTMRQYSLYYLRNSPLGAEILCDLQQSVTQRSITMRGCGILRVGPPNLKVGRGDSIPCAVLDEIAQWQSDAKSAAPDFEVEKSVEYGMSQFRPFDKRFKLSSPYTEDGLPWATQQIGTHGRFLKGTEHDPKAFAHKLVLQGPSPVLRNPTITRVFLTEKRAKDPEAFRREIGAEFAKAIASYLPADLVRAAITLEKKRAPVRGRHYIAAIDPAFRGDAIPLSIGHMEHGGVFVQDVLTSWRGTKDAPLNPGIIIPLIGALCAEYGVRSVLTDQHHVESLQVLAQDAGFFIEPFILGSRTKNQMWADFLTLLNQGKVKLLDHPELMPELLALERTLTKTKQLKIAGRRDDHAVVTAMCLHRALQYAPEADPVSDEVEPTTPEGIKAVLALQFAQSRRRSVAVRPWWNR